MEYICKYCGQSIAFPDNEFDMGGYSHPDGEEMLWEHIQFDHPDIFLDVWDFETPCMLEECYNEVKGGVAA